MTELTSYSTIIGETESLLKEKGSKFIGYAFPISSEEDFKKKLEDIRKIHHQARHYCFAYVLGEMGQTYRAADDGEPSGTAGKPILAFIQGRSLTYTGAVVVRYFGGTKLGKGGLVRAYGSAAKEALDLCTVFEVKLMDRLCLRSTISYGEKIKGKILELGGQVIHANYASDMVLEFDLPKEISKSFLANQLENGVDIQLQEPGNTANKA